MPAVVECVPNFSEGRDAAVVGAIRDAMGGVPGVLLLRTEMDQDHNRSVITFVAPPDAALEAAFQGIRAARDRIDLRRHAGVHPRIGAADVVPFVPLEGTSLAECAALAHRLGTRVWDELGVPVYFYEAAALHPDRRRLEIVRRGGFEKPALAPDLGGPALHPSAGACIVGARRFLIAFNVNLATADVAIAKEIARRIRASSGGMPHVKALGLLLASRGLAQVSMNLTDFEQTPLHLVFDRVRAEAQALGVAVVGSELIGLVPAKALDMAAAHYLRIEGTGTLDVLERRLLQARRERGLQ